VNCDHYPHVQSLQHLRRDPHILAWFTSLRSHQPPLATVTYSIHLFHLRRMLEELAWTEDLPALVRLVLRQDIPRQEQYLPRPIPTDQDTMIQQELLRRDDRNSNAFLLLRHTGMRIGECARTCWMAASMVAGRRRPSNIAILGEAPIILWLAILGAKPRPLGAVGAPATAVRGER
jgi:hypothetical protein